MAGQCPFHFASLTSFYRQTAVSYHSRNSLPRRPKPPRNELYRGEDSMSAMARIGERGTLKPALREPWTLTACYGGNHVWFNHGTMPGDGQTPKVGESSPVGTIAKRLLSAVPQSLDSACLIRLKRSWVARYARLSVLPVAPSHSPRGLSHARFCPSRNPIALPMRRYFDSRWCVQRESTLSLARLLFSLRSWPVRARVVSGIEEGLLWPMQNSGKSCTASPMPTESGISQSGANRWRATVAETRPRREGRGIPWQRGR
jgi:hypothetical protein